MHICTSTINSNVCYRPLQRPVASQRGHLYAASVESSLCLPRTDAWPILQSQLYQPVTAVAWSRAAQQRRGLVINPLWCPDPDPDPPPDPDTTYTYNRPSIRNLRPPQRTCCMMRSRSTSASSAVSVSRMSAEPRLLVITTMQFLKLTVRPCAEQRAALNRQPRNCCA